MKNIVVVGMQWGDEGKGKLVDLLAPSFDVVARYQGGHNAGHTVWIGERKYVLRLVPSGILQEHCVCVIGNGVVVDAQALVEELEGLEAMGVPVAGRLYVSDRAHLILPHHREIERVAEGRLGDERVGTTMRGIGPAYEDKIGRRGIRVGDLLLSGGRLRERLKAAAEETKLIAAAHGWETDLVDEAYERYLAAAERIKPIITDTALYLNDAVASGRRVLLEGAQGTMLDVDHGSYPFVTSSNSTAGGACTGTGLAPTRVTGAIGIAKAYITRVGSGPFATELLDERGRTLQERGNEFGAVTGRPRRPGWFDVPVAKYSAAVNGLDSIALTKLDVLDTFEEIDVCVAYEYQGERIERIPSCIKDYGAVKPIYETFPGWKADTRGTATFDELPANARAYVEALERLVGVEIGLVSTGPDRDETIVRPGSKIANWVES